MECCVLQAVDAELELLDEKEKVHVLEQELEAQVGSIQVICHNVLAFRLENVSSSFFCPPFGYRVSMQLKG